jgi:hypothetical protein
MLAAARLHRFKGFAKLEAGTAGWRGRLCNFFRWAHALGDLNGSGRRRGWLRPPGLGTCVPRLIRPAFAAYVRSVCS